MSRVFISYSHDSPDYKAWVASAARSLAENGLEPVLDQTHLRPGDDINRFAEGAVRSSEFVLLFCTPPYAARANARVRGVGGETALINAELYRGNEDKAIAVLCSGSHQTAIPDYMASRLFVDIRENGLTSDEWTRLIAHLQAGRAADQIGTVVWEAMFRYDADRIYDQPRLRALQRFTEFVETGQNEDRRWFVRRRDPVSSDEAVILFQDPAPEDEGGAVAS